MKTCTKCGERKPETEFHRHRGGTRPDCKTCCNTARALRDAAQPMPRTDSDRLAWRRYYRNNRQERLERARNCTAELSDAYVRRKLVRDTGLCAADVPQALVNLKREHLRLARALKEAEGHEDC